MKITFAGPGLPRQGVLVLAIPSGDKLSGSARELDRKVRGSLQAAIRTSGFSAKPGDVLWVPTPARTSLERVLLIGLGEPAKMDTLALERVGGQLYDALAPAPHRAVVLAAEDIDGCPLPAAEIGVAIAYGALLGSYRFDRHRTFTRDTKRRLRTLKVACATPASARRAFAPLAKVAEGVFLARDLISEPGNVIYPESLAEKAAGLRELGVKVEVLGERAMARLGMKALLGVGQGSAHESKLVVMQWSGGAKGKSTTKPVALVGKGVTFDSGGISIKPALGMEEMKWDMGGAGVVVGLMKALAGRKAQANVVGVLGLVENMPSGTAQRPGDIVTSMSGKTIEVINTDAEGRLVLADALWYTRDRFKPGIMIDLATLTYAIMTALGHDRAGVYANDDTLAGRLIEAGEQVGEPLWRMPLGEEYERAIKSQAADLVNSTGKPAAGASVAAQFLQHFVGKTVWAHLDVAGVMWSKEDKPTVPKGATAFGVRLLDRLIASHYEG